MEDKKIQSLVNVQVDINRAVWASNITDVKKVSVFATEKERDNYIQKFIDSAKKTLSEL